MKIYTLGFTLVEMIVGVTLSLILMISVSVFVSGGLEHIFSQKKILESGGSEITFLSNVTEQLQSIDSKNYYSYASGILFHTAQSLGNSHWILLHEKQEPLLFCDSGSLHPTTNHWLLSNIFSFEGQGADLNTRKSLDAGTIQIFPYSQKIVYNGTDLTGSFITPTFGILTGSSLYVSDTLGQGIYRFDTSNLSQPGVKIIGESSFGSRLNISGNPLSSSLNGPTGLAWGENNLFIADTNNNRILHLNQLTNKLEEFLSSADGLSEPMGLLYDDVRKSLFIVNSGKGELLEYTSFSGSNTPNLNVTFSPGTLTGVTQLRVEFLTTGSGITATPSFSGMTTSEDYQTGATDTFDYYFSNFSQTETSNLNVSMPGCTPSTVKYLEGGIPKKEVVTCSGVNTGSFEKFYGNNSLNFSYGADYGLTLQNVVGNFNASKSYAIKLSLFSSGIEKWQNYFPFFTRGDNQIITEDDNRLRVVKSGFKYPTGIYKQGGNYFVYDFLDRKRREIDINGVDVSSIDTPAFDFQNKGDHFSDQIFPLPLSSFRSSFVGNMLNVELKYFKNFSCYDEKTPLEKTYLWKKFIPN